MCFARDIIDQRILNMQDLLIQAKEKAEQEKAKQEQLKIEKQTKTINFIQNLPKELNFDETKLEIFIKVSKICCEHYLCDEFDELDSDEIFDQNLFIKILQTKIFATKYYTGGGLSSAPLQEVSDYWKIKDLDSYKKLLTTYSGSPLEATELIMSLDEEFKIEISGSEAQTLETVKDIVEIIYTKIVS